MKKQHGKSSKCEGRGGREAGRVAFISEHCVNYQKEDSFSSLFAVIGMSFPAQ